MPKDRARKDSDKSPWRLLLCAAVGGILFGLLLLGDLEDLMRASRNSLHWHKASGDIVVVKIDNASLRDVGRWPWPRRYHAQLIERLSKAKAERVFVDIGFFGSTTKTDDDLLARAVDHADHIVLASRTRSGPSDGTEEELMPSSRIARNAEIGSISWHYNFQNAVSRVPYSTRWRGKIIPSFSSLLSGRTGPPGSTFIPDYSIDPNSIPSISASEVLSPKFNPDSVRGKDIIIGTANAGIGDQYFVPGTGRMAGVFVHVIAAETLRSGKPVNLGWLPLYLLALGAAYVAVQRRNATQQFVITGATAILIFFGPAVFEANLIFFDVLPATFTLGTLAIILSWQQFRKRGLVNEASGLPNLNALRRHQDGKKQAIVAARILNFEEIVAALPATTERQLIDQIVSRLNVGSPARVLYQGDAGIFAWFEEPRTPFGNHLDALHTLFRNPARVAGMSIDLQVAFGVEMGSGRSLANRLASALVAADEAAHQGLKWKYHDPETLEGASWKLSILSQLDEAIDRGEVWVAFQPKLDLATRRIMGAEALARWTHPEKGPIAASEFVAAAEQHNRIGKLTDFVLEKAVAAAVQMNKRRDEFEIAVNLSARLLADKSFTLRLAALLARHGLPAKHLTLELTETAALVSEGEGLEMIARLRDLGVNLAIDDYGTGQSTLEYLKKIPANEIKIDQSFVKGIVDSRSDRLMVQSTVSLAHSLGRRVVAEGVEHQDILALLVEMGCDVAQGFAIGRPMGLDSLAKRVAAERKRSAA